MVGVKMDKRNYLACDELKMSSSAALYANNKALIIFQQACKSPALFARFDRILLSHETSQCQVTS